MKAEMPMAMLHLLGRLEVVPSNLKPSVAGAVTCQALTCTYFGAFAELYLTWCMSLPASDPCPVT